MTFTTTQDVLPQLLLVEDSETSAALIVRYLKDRYQVLHARDGEAAWHLVLSEHDVQLLVTDIQMPRMSGHELLRKIRACDVARISSLPVIVMTSANDNSERDLAFANGANDFITKPMDRTELLARVGVHQKLAHTIRALEEHQRLLQEQATTDPLTNLKNRRAFAEVGLQHFMLAQRHSNDLSLIALDIDHFKKINDTYGHAGGDEALVAIAQVLMTSTRQTDIVARVGGEEFSILLPNTNRVGAGVLAERIRVAVKNNKFSVAGSQLSLTVSVGVAAFGNEAKDSLEQLMEVADRRLYLAKQAGRNRVVIRGGSRAEAGDSSSAGA